LTPIKATGVVTPPGKMPAQQKRIDLSVGFEAKLCSAFARK
jgi:hypothetical protein